MEIVVSSSFEPLLWDESRYLVMCGGRGSGKSEFAGRKILLRCEKEGRHRFLIVRKIRRTCADSVVYLMRRILTENDIPFDFNKSDHTLSFVGPAGSSELVFGGLDDPEKIKSFTGMTSIWVEEATELSRDDLLKLDLCLREPGPGYHQIMLTFNPQEVEARWLKDMFFGPVPYPGATVHNSTVDDNPLKRLDPRTWQAYVGTLDGLKDQDEALYQIARLGLWATRSGQIFGWDVAPWPKDEDGRPRPRDWFDEVWYGGDHGYSVDPAAVVRIHRKAWEFWLEQVVYRQGLTNQDLGVLMREQGVDGEPVYFDSAEPKSNEELRRMGFRVRDAVKGPDSVRAGIDFMKGKCRVHILEGSQDLYREHNSYCWRKNKSGDTLPEPVEFDNHAMDAVRYGIFSHCAKPKARVWSA